MKTAIFSLLFFVGISTFANTPPTLEFGEVTLEELKGLVESKTAVIIDVNSEKSFKEGHIPGAVSYAAKKGKLQESLPRDTNALIVAYCGGEMCSAWKSAAKEAKKLGYTNIKHYKGGISGWKKAGLTTNK